MTTEQAARITALLRSGRVINIGGRPVSVPPAIAQSTTHDRTHAIKLAFAFVAIYVVWGTTYLAIRYAVETIPPLVTAGVRHTAAGLILLGIAWSRGFRPRREHWIAGAALGALFFLVGHGSLHWAEQYVSSGLAALLVASEPLWILLLGAAMGQQSINWKNGLGLLMEIGRAHV